MKRTQLTNDSVRFDNENTQTVVTPERITTYRYENNEPSVMLRVKKGQSGITITKF